MSDVEFDLVHGTSKECAANIQRTIFELSEGGYFGPAVYFYDILDDGIECAKKWIDKKIKNGRIKNKNSSIILIAKAHCDDKYFLDGTVAAFKREIKKIAKKAREDAYRDARARFEREGIPIDKRKIDIEVNRERNAYIEKLEENARRKFKIFKGCIKSEKCVAVRDVTCISGKPYEEIEYG